LGLENIKSIDHLDWNKVLYKGSSENKMYKIIALVKEKNPQFGK
jgi:hypothetical protein